MADETTERHFPPPFVITVCAVVAVGLYVLLTFKDGCPPSGNLDAFYPLRQLQSQWSAKDSRSIAADGAPSR